MQDAGGSLKDKRREDKRQGAGPMRTQQKNGGRTSARTNLAAAFMAARGGNIAMMFGLLLAPMLLAGGLAVDLVRANTTRAVVQEAADAALLAAARLKGSDPGATDDELNAAAKKFFNHMTRNLSGLDTTCCAVSFDSATDTYSLDVTADMKTALMRIAGQDTVPVGAASRVKLGPPPPIEIAMALDNTGSMGNNGKIQDLRDAANGLVDDLTGIPGSDVQFSLVPFAQYVNIGSAYNGETWLDASASGFAGCVGSRSNPNNTRDSNYGADPVPGLGVPASQCPNEITPLTRNKTTITDAINAMGANGWTYIPAGLSWGWRALTPDAPLSGARTKAQMNDLGGLKALILMTDGENTRSPTYPAHDGWNTDLANTLTTELCDNVKNDGNEIIVFTIAFAVSDQEIKDIMEDCATKPEFFLTPDNGAELKAEFEAIARNLRALSVSG